MRSFSIVCNWHELNEFMKKYVYMFLKDKSANLIHSGVLVIAFFSVSIVSDKIKDQRSYDCFSTFQMRILTRWNEIEL